MTAPHDSHIPYVPGYADRQPTSTTPPLGQPQAWQAPLPPSSAPPGPPAPGSRAGLIAVLVLGVLVLMAATGLGVWIFTRPDTTAAPATSPSAPPSVDVAGTVVLKQGQFTWNSVGDPTCQGWKGFEDIQGGASVTITDAGGKALLVGSLGRGTAQGITTESDGMHRAGSCELPFIVSGVPGGVGPYGVEVSHRGVVHVNEGQLGSVQLSL